MVKVAVKKVNTLRRELNIEVPQDRIAKAYDDVYRAIGKHAKVKGFRQGKAPRAMLEQSHSQLAQEEVIKKIVPEAYHEAIQTEKLDPIDYPDIAVDGLKDGVLTFKATLDLRPEVTVKLYKGLKVTKKSSEVSDEELNKTLEFFQQSKGKEEKVELTDDFAKTMGFPGLDDFKSAIRKQMESDKERHNRLDVETQIVDQLVKATKFDAPESLINKQYQGRIQDMQNRMQQQGVAPDQIEKQIKENEKVLKETAEKDVRIFLILNEIAKLEDIKVENQNESVPAKTMEFLLKEAKWEDEKPAKKATKKDAKAKDKK